MQFKLCVLLQWLPCCVVQPTGRRETGAAMMQTTKCGDEVENGKPAPDCFHATAAKIGVAPEDCLVIEDAPAGVQAATAAGMRVVVVPSIRDKDAYPKADPKAAAGRDAIHALIDRRTCNEGSQWCTVTVTYAEHLTGLECECDYPTCLEVQL